MKKVTTIILSMLCVLSLAACGGTQQKPEESGSTIDYLSFLDDACNYVLTTDEAELKNLGFQPDGEVGFSFTKNENTVFGDDTTISNTPGFFITYSWSIDNKSVALSQSQDIVKQFTDKLGTPACEVDEANISFSDDLLEKLFEDASKFDAIYTFKHSRDGRNYDVEVNVRCYGESSMPGYFLHISVLPSL